MADASSVEFHPESGLAPAVVQSAEDGRVLMLAYMNAEALRRTLERGRVTFWSRSRGELWEKGETSGHWLEAMEVRTDCDGDALLVRARPHGPTCHTGTASCFQAGSLQRPAGDPRGSGASPERAAGAFPEASPFPGSDDDRSEEATVHRGSSDELGGILDALWDVVESRDRERPAGSYTVRLLDGGPRAAAGKVAEEAVESALAAVSEPGRLAEESADLLYHLLVLWRTVGLRPGRVAEVLARRRAAREGDPDGA